MMGFITRYCKKINATINALRHGTSRLLASGAVFAALWMAAAVGMIATVGSAGAAQSNGIEVRKAAITATEDGYVLEAELDMRLTPASDDALHKGVPLYFVFEFELTRSRWYWTNEKVASVQQQQRLSFNTLTRQYRVGVGALYQNFSSLKEALDYMSRIRRRNDIEPGALRKDNTYYAMLRLRLDTTQLPKPFQLHTGRDWGMNSDWYRWTVHP